MENITFVNLNLPKSSAHIDKTGLMQGEQVRLTCITNHVTISTANPYLNGTGTMTDLITGGGQGTIINKITIKAQTSTTEGMIRIFHYDTISNRLLKEIEVPSITQSTEDITYETTIDEFFMLKANHKLKVSTEKAETFIITIEGQQMSYPT